MPLTKFQNPLPDMYADIPGTILSMARTTIIEHFAQHYSVSGKPTPLKDNITDIEVKFHPVVLPLAMAQLPLPQEVDGVRITYAETPLKGQAWGMDTMAHYLRNGVRRGSRGIILRRLPEVTGSIGQIQEAPLDSRRE